MALSYSFAAMLDASLHRISERAMMKHLTAALLLAFAPVAPLLAQAAPAPAATQVRLNLDTPIETIAADPAGKAVLNAIFPEMLGHPEYENFKAMTLRQVQPLAQGAITDEAMAKAQAELAKIK